MTQIIFDENKYFFTLIMRFEKQKESIYYRKYKKIDSALAQVGGVAKALMMIGFIFCIPFNQLHLHHLIAGQLFNFNDERQDKIKVIGKSYSVKDSLPPIKESKLKQASSKRCADQNNQIQRLTSIIQNGQMQSERNMIQQYQQLPSIQWMAQEVTSKSHRNLKLEDITNINNNFFNSNNVQQEKDNKKLNQEKDEIKDDSEKYQIDQKYQNEERIEKKSIQLSWYEYIRYYICPWGQFKEKKEKLDFAIDKIYSHLDMLTIVHKLIELERIKQLLFDENQIKLIQFLPKPSINKQSLTNSKSTIIGAQKRSKNYSYSFKGKQSQVDLLMEFCIPDAENDKKSQQAFIAIKNIFSKGKLNSVDTKILEMLDDSFLSCIDEHIQTPLKQDINDLTFMQPTQQNLLKEENAFQQENQSPKFNNSNERNNENLIRNIIQRDKQQIDYQTEQQLNNFLPEKICTSVLEFVREQENVIELPTLNNPKQVENESEMSSIQNNTIEQSQEQPTSQIDDKYLHNHKFKFMKQKYPH